MIIFGMFLGRPGATALDAVLAGVAGRDVTYDHVGSTLEPGGRGRPRFREDFRDVGRGEADLATAKVALRSWAGHRHIGATVHPPTAAITVGTDLVVALPVGPLTALAPDRVVAVVDEPDRLAFAYGTLPGHPERGEESFCVALRADGTVRFTIAVDAVPGNVAMWIGSPAVTWMQRRALAGYLAGVAASVAAAH